jgi:hypothetical protein
MWSIIREIFIYLCFLCFLNVITYSNMNSNGFYQVNHLRKFILNKRQSDQDYTKVWFCKTRIHRHFCAPYYCAHKYTDGCGWEWTCRWARGLEPVGSNIFWPAPVPDKTNILDQGPIRSGRGSIRRTLVRAEQRRRRIPLPFGYLSVWGAVWRPFYKSDIFPTTINSCSSGKKAGLTQSSSA